MQYQNLIKKEFDFYINKDKSNDFLLNESIKYNLKNNLNYKEIKVIFNLILENYKLFLLDENKEFSEYYKIVLSDKSQKLISFTINGCIMFSDMIKKIFVDEDFYCFFNIKNKVLYDTKKKDLLNNISRMFNTKKIIFIDWNVSINVFLQNEKLEMLLFYKNKFYLLKTMNILYCKNNILDYYSYTNISYVQNKCDLCGIFNYEYVIEEDFVFKRKFNKFCKKCYKIITIIPSSLKK